MSTLKIRVGKRTSIGNYRDNNEDRLYVDESRFLYLVADGMGGQAAGEQASQIAVELIPQQLLSVLGGDGVDVDDVRETVKDAITAANEAIIAQGVADPSVQNMGTTVVVALVCNDQMLIAHLGDSPALLVREEKIEQLTIDHNLAQALFDANTISEEELKTHRFRHVLWKYLGSKEANEGPDISVYHVQAGDRIVLASDGLTGSVENEGIRQIVLKFDEPQKCADQLVHLALESGSKDNVTCIVLYVDEV